MKVFVYGTLRKDSWNHRVMWTGDSEFLCYAKTKEPKIMIDVGIPYLYDFSTAENPVRESNYHVIGEIYEVNNIAPLDQLESNGYHYERKIDNFIKLKELGANEYEDTAEELEAWVYYSCNEKIPDNYDFIEDFVSKRGL